MVGKITASRAVLPGQVEGVILRLLKSGIANFIAVTEISEETFNYFYEERGSARQKDEQ